MRGDRQRETAARRAEWTAAVTTPQRIVRVSQEHISAARAVIRMSGDPDKVPPLIRKVAEAAPAADGVGDHPAT